MTLTVARQVLETEAEAIRRLADLIGEDFERAVNMVVACTGRVVWTGMGKSGIICHKLAATMRSTGTPALHLHPADAIHGDLGMVVAGDLVVAISHSGTTEEILRLVEFLKRQAIPLIAFTSYPDSPLAQAADLHLDLGVRREACPLNLAPTASTTASLALGDALAMAVSVRKGFREEDFALLHPGGRLGKRFLKVGDLMHHGADVPRVAPDTPMKDVIYEMSRKGLGVATVQDGDGRLLGVITDGDLRRLMERDTAPLDHAAAEVMHPGGVAIGAGELASAALRLLEERRITSLMVCGPDGRVEGVLHLHDLWGVGLF
ncbi:MAG TPA: KpsF/GutQ family sugar-phosphate isomerase [Thermoanaerobaculales bacterium]|mgnify:FL=1|nr:KpsF/GutQ family sugar-phosphate isomerase [Thermoanaerobaculales bacterium]